MKCGEIAGGQWAWLEMLFILAKVFHSSVPSWIWVGTGFDYVLLTVVHHFLFFFWSTPSLVFPKLGHLTSFHICQKSHPFQRRVNKARFNSNSTPNTSYLKVHTNDNIICICRNDAGYIIRVKHWTIQTIFWLDFQISPPWTSPPHLPNFSLTITT